MGVSFLAMSTVDAPLCLPPLPLSRRPEPLPAGTVDTHFHVFEAGAPLTTPRSYTPQVCTIADWRDYADAVGIARGILVQPSVYGLDNSVMLRAIASDPARLRGVAVVAPDTTQAALAELDRGGIRGLRINTRNKGGVAFSAVPDFAAKVADLGWSLQFQVLPEQLDAIAGLPVTDTPLVLDHLGFILFGQPETATRLDGLRRLLDRPDIHVKISAPYRLSKADGYADVGATIAALARSHPHRLLWGSDWPHTELWQNVPDDAELIESCYSWIPDAATRRQILVDNPTALFFAR